MELTPNSIQRVLALPPWHRAIGAFEAKANLSRGLMVLKLLFLGGGKCREVLHTGAGICDWDGEVW